MRAKIGCLLAAAVFCLVTAVRVSGADPAGSGNTGKYAKPEDVVQAFCGFVANADFEQAMELFPFRERAQKPDNYAEFLAKTFAIDPKYPFPAEIPGYSALNQATVKAKVAKDVIFFVRQLLLSGEFDDLLRSFPASADAISDERATAYFQAIDSSRLSGLKLARLYVISDDSPHFSEVQKEHWKMRAQRGLSNYGADEIVTCQAFYELDGQYTLFFHLLCKYGEIWKMGEVVDVMGNDGKIPYQRIAADAFHDGE